MLSDYGCSLIANENQQFYHASVTRSDCATGAFPANGMLYYTPNGCGCVTQLRGYQGYSSGTPGDPALDSERLENGSGIAKQMIEQQIAMARIDNNTIKLAKAKGDQPPDNVIPRVPVSTTCPIRDEWHNNDLLPYPETAPVTVNGQSYVAVVNEHRMEARTGSTVVWSFTAGGRISNPPVVEYGKVMFGSHDGFIYCLRESDGSLLWRYMAARNSRTIVAHAQLESAWPVFGVVLHKGLICFSAGRHPEVDGGIYVGGLLSGTGELKWKGTIHPYDPKWLSIDIKTKEENRRNSIINEVMKVSGDLLTLPGATIDPNNPPNAQVTPHTNQPAVKPAVAALNAGWFSIPEAGRARLTVYDFSGSSAGVLFNGVAVAGRNSYKMENVKLSAGSYTFRLQWNGHTLEKKFIVQ